MIPVCLPHWWSGDTHCTFPYVYYITLDNSPYLPYFILPVLHLPTNGMILTLNHAKKKKMLFHLHQYLKHGFEINHEYMTTLIKWIKGHLWIGSFSVQTWGLWTAFGGCTVLLSTTRATHNKNHRASLQQSPRIQTFVHGFLKQTHLTTKSLSIQEGLFVLFVIIKQNV